MTSTIRKINPQLEYYFVEGCFILELSNTPDDPDLSIARARVRPGVTTRLHRLHKITERYVILEGMGMVSVDGEAARPVGPGDVVIIPPDSPQQISNTGRVDLVFLALCTPRFVPGAYENIDT
ncbi:cupin 2, conserved barrel domain protein [Desulfosarcina variabilis str. Montpellier]|uniref:cupin domain-containing protein n=1 Tax=Desulfosarcina variabilis TaxID=2300 RepID=UPI003AFA17C6